MRTIIYCKCGVRLRESDFVHKLAFKIKDAGYCLRCLMSFLRSVPEDVKDVIVHQLMDEPSVKTPLPQRRWFRPTL